MYSNLKHILQMIIINKCQLRWHQKWTFLSTKLNQIKHNTDNWTFPIKISREFEVILTKLEILTFTNLQQWPRKNPQFAQPERSKLLSKY